MTLVVTRDVPARFRGFLASCMLELAPGVYTSPAMSKAVRERVWTVLASWYAAEVMGQVVMTWPDSTDPCGQCFLLLGDPPKDLFDVDGIVLVRRDLSGTQAVPGSMKTE
jgi:CRISPR-associated protein Cas2